jgi:putative transposase
MILRAVERKRNGKDPNPSAAIMDSQSAKTTEESAGREGHDARRAGYDAHKHVKGRKRHLLVDTLGLPLSIYVSPADVQERVGARRLLAGLKPLVPRLKKIWADGAYTGEELARWCKQTGE